MYPIQYSTKKSKTWIHVHILTFNTSCRVYRMTFNRYPVLYIYICSQQWQYTIYILIFWLMDVYSVMVFKPLLTQVKQTSKVNKNLSDLKVKANPCCLLLFIMEVIINIPRYQNDLQVIIVKQHRPVCLTFHKECLYRRFHKLHG